MVELNVTDPCLAPGVYEGQLKWGIDQGIHWWKKRGELISNDDWLDFRLGVKSPRVYPVLRCVCCVVGQVHPRQEDWGRSAKSRRKCQDSHREHSYGH